MKFLFSELAFFFDASRERNIAILLKFSILDRKSTRLNSSHYS